MNPAHHTERRRRGAGARGRGLGRLRAGCLALGALVVLWADPGHAQLAATEGGGEPIEVLSDDGIEWHRDKQMYVARGNAVAVQGEDRVSADVLLAHYRQDDDGNTQIWRMEGHGNARIESPDQTVSGDVLVYEIESGILVITGESLRMETATELVTARDSLEYWSKQNMAVARGQAYARQSNGDVIEADVLTGYFGDEAGDGDGDGDGGEEGAGGLGAGMGPIERMEAFGNVVITTAQEVVRGGRAVYDTVNETMTVVDNVTITTPTDQLGGDRMVMNMKTGENRLTGAGDADGGGRARALIVPQRPRTDPVDQAPTETTPVPAN